MSKWIQFYHKINKFDLVSMRFTEDFSIVEMTGMDSILPVDGRLSLSSIRILHPHRSYDSVCFRKSGVQSLARIGQYDNVLPAINQNRIYYDSRRKDSAREACREVFERRRVQTTRMGRESRKGFPQCLKLRVASYVQL